METMLKYNCQYIHIFFWAECGRAKVAVTSLRGHRIQGETAMPSESKCSSREDDGLLLLAKL
jgi:hypothetical protein